MHLDHPVPGETASVVVYWPLVPGRSRSPVAIIRRAGPFGRDHRRPQRPLGRAMDAEGRAIVRLLDGPARPRRQCTRPALRPRCRLDAEPALGIELPRRPRRARPLAGISPMPRHLRATDSKTSCDQFQRRQIALGANAAGVLVLHFRPARFELLARTSTRLAGCPAARSRSPRSARGTSRRWADTRPCRSSCRRARPPESPARGWPASPAWPPWPAAPARARPAPRNSSAPAWPPAPRPSRWRGRWSRSRRRRTPPAAAGFCAASVTASIGE